MSIKLYQVDGLTTEETAALRALNAAVYPPAAVADWPGKSIEWAAAQWRVIAWDNQGAALTHVGVILRDGMVHDTPVKIGGIGGVMTHPQARRQGWARQGIARAVDFFHEHRADFALLVCDPKLVPLYQRLGWQLYNDPMFVTQHNQRVQFTFNLPMVLSICATAPTSGTIDLQGPPW